MSQNSYVYENFSVYTLRIVGIISNIVVVPRRGGVAVEAEDHDRVNDHDWPSDRHVG